MRAQRSPDMAVHKTCASPWSWVSSVHVTARRGAVHRSRHQSVTSSVVRHLVDAEQRIVGEVSFRTESLRSLLQNELCSSR